MEFFEGFFFNPGAIEFLKELLWIWKYSASIVLQRSPLLFFFHIPPAMVSILLVFHSLQVKISCGTSTTIQCLYDFPISLISYVSCKLFDSNKNPYIYIYIHMIPQIFNMHQLVDSHSPKILDIFGSQKKVTHTGWSPMDVMPSGKVLTERPRLRVGDSTQREKISTDPVGFRYAECWPVRPENPPARWWECKKEGFFVGPRQFGCWCGILDVVSWGDDFF